MSEEAATLEVSAETKKMGDEIVGLTLKQAKELSDYLKSEYGIEPAAGGAVMMAPAGGGGDEAAVEQTEFDVVLTGFGDKKLDVVRKVKSLVGGTLIEAKKLVEGCPATIKEKADKEEAEKIKTDLEGAGASVELK